MSLDARATRRIARERRTLGIMIGRYCAGNHGPRAETLCGDCEALWTYAQTRLDRCVFADEKPTCAICPVHCYEATMRERVRNVMRWAGPRMLLPHPILTLLHLRDEKRPLSAKAQAIRARRQQAANLPA